MTLSDETIKVFINTKGTMEDIDKEFLELMNFFNGELPTSGIAKDMKEEIDKVKKKEDWRVEYMLMLELEREKYREGLEQGIRYFVKHALKYGADMETIITDIMDEYGMTREQVNNILDE